MELKRIFKDTPEGKKVDHMRVGRLTPTQKFTQRTLDKGFAEGWLSIGDGKITIKSSPSDVVYKIVAKPGLYCCFDNEPLDDEKSAREYVNQQYAAQESPDRNNPAGYRKDKFYLCELLENQ